MRSAQEHEAVIVTDVASRVLFMNAMAERLTGFGAVEASGRPVDSVFQLVDEASLRPLSGPVGLVLADGQEAGWTNHSLLRSRDGREVSVAESASALRDHSGRINGAVLLFCEQGEAPAADPGLGPDEAAPGAPEPSVERALRESRDHLARSEHRFQELIANSWEVLLTIDGDGRIQPAAPSSAGALGWAAAELAGRPVLDLVHPADRQRARAGARRLRDRPAEVAQFTVRVLHRDGSYRLIEGILRNLLSDPAVRALVANGRDVTRERELEEHFRQAQRLESVGRLAGGVAHDFNNLLTVIDSCCCLALEAVAPDHPLAAELTEIARASRRAKDLTRQLLAFSRQQVLEPRELDLNELVEGMASMLRRLLGEDVELVVAAARGLWTTLADRGQLEQVLMNLSINARDAMPGGGRLVIETANVVLDERDCAEQAGARPGSYVMLSVTDSGIGMDAETRARLFEPFFTTKKPGRGTGLGLSTVYGIVAQSGGFLRVRSEPGRGATFTLLLPRVAAAGARPAREALPPARPRATLRPGGEPATVLLVEDDGPVRRLAVRILGGAGYQVVEAASSEQALERCRSEPAIDLLVTDVVMPGMGGRDLAARLGGAAGRDGAPRPLKVLYMSGYAENAVVRDGQVEPGLHLLGKPFSPADLLDRVAALLADG